MNKKMTNKEIEREDKEIQNLLWTQEDCSQRNNMWVEGIVETPQESWNDMEEKLHRFFREHFGIENIPLERAHQVDRKE